MLDFARNIRGLMNRFSTMEVLGVPIDWFFHMLGAVLFVILVSRYLNRRKVVILTVGLMLAKELFDVFAKTRVEYIRAPGLDLALDLTSGLVGLGLGLWIVHRFGRAASS